MPDDSSTLASLQLTALRADQPGLSLQISDRLLHDAKDPAVLANAWFNRGLACEGRHYYDYGGQTYCRSDPLVYFVNAWKLAHSPVRGNKIDQMITTAKLACTVQQGLSTWHIVVAYWEEESATGKAAVRQRIYVRHDARESIAASDVGWSEPHTFGQSELRFPQLLERLDLGPAAITVLEPAWPFAVDLEVRGQTCHLPFTR